MKYLYHTPKSLLDVFQRQRCGDLHRPGPLEGIRGGKERHPPPGRRFGTGRSQGTCRATRYPLVNIEKAIENDHL